MPHAPSLVLSPFALGTLELRNRVAFLATVNNLGRNRLITDEQVAFYEARARGGAGVIITEGMSVHPTSIPNGTIPLAYEPDLVPGLRRIAEAVHRHGAAVLGQLWHVGRQALWNPTLRPWSPSGGRDPYSGTTAHAMSDEDVQQVVDGFATAARHLQAAGFDGVELHGAHGYLLTQFLSPWSNHRDDRWGGSTRNRARIVLEIIRAVRAACGDGFAVGLKISAHEYVDGGLDLEESQRLMRVFAEEAPPDYVGVSQANFSPSLEKHVPDLTFDDAPFAHLAAGVRDAAGGVPVMAMAKVPDLAAAERLLADGAADLVGMSRAWLADPELVNAVARGAAPRPCTYCNICWDFIHTGRAVSCMYAPETGREHTLRSKLAATTNDRRVVRVVGGGLAGLEAARTAGENGHDVHLYEARDRLGGRLLDEAAAPGRERMGLAVDWLEQSLRDLGVQVHLGHSVTAETAADWGGHDVVVLCTGARPVVDPVPGTDQVLSLRDAWERRRQLQGPVVIVDEMEEEPLYATATALARDGLEVHVVTRREAIARRVAYVSRIGVLRRLDEAGVRIHPQQEVISVKDGQLTTAHVFSRRARVLTSVKTVVRAGPAEPTDPLDTGGRETIVVGDASAPRSYVAVNQEAHDAIASIGAASASTRGRSRERG
ncbi:MAG: FAD-dependent oxidoreductase [Micromonosporaceae bacterium]